MSMTVSELADSRRRMLPGQNDLPCEDGEPMETGFHDAQDALLKDTLIDAWDDRSDFFVAGNMFVYFSERQVKNNDFRGPDVFVVLDVERKGRKCWVAWEEDGRLPDVVIEVTSETTKAVDRGEKMEIYAKTWRTPAYFIFDPETERLEGFALDTAQRKYTPLKPDARGDLEVLPLGLKLGLRRTVYRDYDQLFVRWLDEHGKPLPTARERTERERTRTREALSHVQELERQLAERDR